MSKTKRIILDIAKAILIASLRAIGIAAVFLTTTYLFDNFLSPTLIAIVVLLFGVAVYLTYKDIHQI